MKNRDRTAPQSDTKCSRCGKPVASPHRLGSITAYFFQASYCSCEKTLKSASARASNKEGRGQSAQFCPGCGLVKEEKGKIGSLTSFLFQNTRCRCGGEEKFDAASMSQRFWKLKKGGESSSFRPSQAAAAAGRTDVDLADGAIIAGVYRIESLIGRGGMGEVYLAQHLTLGKRCALKVIPPKQVTEVGWQRFQTEAKLFARLDHKHLVRVFDLGIHDGCLPFYAMDYVEGKTLADFVTAKGRLSASEAVEIFGQVCEGVDFAHRNGVIHRDLKPANIMIEFSKAGQVSVKILDFGLAKLNQHDRAHQSLTAVGEVFGSPFYMSPEQCKGDKLDNRSDIYSVGCTLFEALTERPPFTGNLAYAIMNGHQSSEPPSLSSVIGADKLPQSMEVIVAKLLRKNPVERYQTMAELKGDLDRVGRGEGVEPFYVSRSRAGTAPSKPMPSREFQLDLRPEEQIQRLLIGTLIVLGLCGTAVAFLLAGPKSTNDQAAATRRWLSKPPEIRGKAEEYVDQAVNSDANLSPSYWNGRPFFGGTFIKNGINYKRWSFPADGLTGEMRFETNDGPQKKPLAGYISLPVSTKVEIALTTHDFGQEDLVRGFTDGNIDGIYFEKQDIMMLRVWTSLLRHLRSTTAIHIDSISGDAEKTRAQVIHTFNTFPNLTELDTSMFSDASFLSKIDRMKELKSIKLINVLISDSTCIAVAKCTNLENLNLTGTMNRRSADPVDFSPLANLKNLKVLRLGVIRFGPTITMVLLQCPALKEVALSINKPLTKEQIITLRKAAPHAQIMINSGLIEADYGPFDGTKPWSGEKTNIDDISKTVSDQLLIK